MCFWEKARERVTREGSGELCRAGNAAQSHVTYAAHPSKPGMPSRGSFVCNPRRCLASVYSTKPCMKPASTPNSLIIHLIIVWKQPLLNACLTDPKSPYLPWENKAFSRFTNKLKVWEVDIFCLSVCCTNDLNMWFLPTVLRCQHPYIHDVKETTSLIWSLPLQKRWVWFAVFSIFA